MTPAGGYRIVRVCSLGRTEYGSCWNLQQHLHARRIANDIADTFLLTEHDHVYTIGTSGDDNHLLAGEQELHSRGIAVFHNDRGGDITYHGPGQFVGYPILRLEEYYRDLHRYLRDLEEVIVRTLGEFGVQGKRMPEYTGVWVGNEKICAIGVKASRWVTMHGFALNVSTDLSYFDRIIPCGIFEKGVTSLEMVLGRKVAMQDVSPPLLHHFADVFGVQVTESAPGPERTGVFDHFSHNKLQGILSESDTIA